MSRGLRDRPAVGELVEAGIQCRRRCVEFTVANPEVAPSLRANARSLEQNMKRDSVRQRDGE